MTGHRISQGCRHMKGFSLIELMVSLTIGLLLATAAFSAYLGASAASKMSDAQIRMNEDAQAALVILSQQLKMAGNNPDRADRIDNADPAFSSRHNPVYGDTSFATGTYTTSEFSVRGCDGRFSNIATAASLDQLTCAGSVTSLPDSIAVSYEADSFNTIPTTQATGKLPTDCVGKKLSLITAALPTVVGAGTASATVTYFIAENRFYIAASHALASSSLYCKGNGEGSTPQALVNNVEDMQISYGAVSMATTSTVATVAGYLSAGEIAALGSSSNDPLPWEKVLAVRVCVLVRSEGQVVSEQASARYLNCEGSLAAIPADRRLRQAYFATVLLRNRRL